MGGLGKLGSDSTDESRVKAIWSIVEGIAHFESAIRRYEKEIQSTRWLFIGISLGLFGNFFVTGLFELGPIEFIQNISGEYWSIIKYLILVVTFIPFFFLAFYMNQYIKRQRRMIESIEKLEGYILNEILPLVTENEEEAR